MKLIFSIMISVFLFVNVQAKIHHENVEYKDGNTVLEGYLAYNDAITGKRPTIIVVHEWWGLNNYIKRRCNMLAKLGYVAFAADIYGKGNRATTPQEAGKLASIYTKNTKLARERIVTAYNLVRKYKFVDTNKMAVIGYCFGGGVAMELGMSGANIKGIVTFHGALNLPDTSDIKNIKAKVLILHGANDPYVKREVINKLMGVMDRDGIVYEVNFYSNTVHAFTNPASGNDPSKGVAYNKLSDERSWQAMKDFFHEIFGT